MIGQPRPGEGGSQSSQASVAAQPRHTSVHALQDPKSDWGLARRHSVQLIRTGAQPRQTIGKLNARKAVARQPTHTRTASALDTLTHAGPKVTREPVGRDRALSLERLPSDVLAYKKTFQGGRVRTKLVQKGQTLYRYHTDTGEKVGRFCTTKMYATAEAAGRALGMPATPTHVTVLHANADMVTYVGEAAAAFGRYGGGPQTFVRPADLGKLRVASTELLRRE